MLLVFESTVPAIHSLMQDKGAERNSYGPSVCHHSGGPNERNDKLESETYRIVVA